MNRKRLPSGSQTNIVVAVAVPVVDVETVLVEVADTREVAARNRKVIRFHL